MDEQGPASVRTPAAVPAPEVIASIAAELCPEGPRPSAEIAADLGCVVEAAELPLVAPVFVRPDGRTILYRADERAERSILEGAAAIALSQRGIKPQPEAVRALAARLSRPAVVRSAGGG